MTEHELYKTLIRNNLADRERVREAAKRMPASAHTLRRALVAAACLLAALAVTVMCIPTARAAVLSFFSRSFDERNYLGQDPESRAEDPIAVIDALRLDDRIHAGRLNVINEDYRAEIAGHFDMCIEEIFCDGRVLYLCGSLGGTAARYLTQPMGGGADTQVLLSREHWQTHTLDDWDPTSYDPADRFYWEFAYTRFDALREAGGRLSCDFALVQEDVYAAFDTPEEAEPHTPETHERNELRMNEYLAAGGRLRFTASLGGWDPAAPRAWMGGLQRDSFRFQLSVGYEDCACCDTPGALFTVDFEPISVDLSGRDADERTLSFDDASVTLSGEAFLSDLVYGERLRSKVLPVSLDGIRMSLHSLQLFPMSANITMEYDLPDDWTDEQAQVFLQGNGGMGVELYINGESLKRSVYDYHPGTSAYVETQDAARRIYRVTHVELGIDPRDYAAIETFRIVPVILYYTDSPVQPEDAGGWKGEAHVQRFDDNAIEVRLF